VINDYKVVQEAWGDKLKLADQPIPKEQAIKVALSLYEYMFGKPWKGKTRLTSGRRYTWVRNGELVVNPDMRETYASGWRSMVHDLSHYGHAMINRKNNNHGKVHAEFEAELARYVIRKYF